MKFILHSVSYSNAWEGQTSLPLYRFVDKAAELGYDGIELMAKRPHASVLDLGKPERTKLKGYIASKGLELPCIAGYHDFSDDHLHPDIAKGEKELLFLRQTIRLARDLGARILRIYSSFLYPDVQRSLQWRQCIEYLREGVRYAEDDGVILAMQNHSELTINHVDVLEMIHEIGSPSLKMALDPPYICMTGVPYDKAVEDCKDVLAYSTTSDFIRIDTPVNTRIPGFLHYSSGFFLLFRKKTVPLGQGEVDYRSFLSSLKKIGYDDYLAYEICSPIIGGGSEENLDRCAKESLNFLKGLWKEL